MLHTHALIYLTKTGHGLVAYSANIDISLLYFIQSMNKWHRIPDGKALPDYISE